MTMYAVAERLHMSIEDVGRMKLKEYMGWIFYMSARSEKANDGNVMNMAEQDMIHTMTR